MSLRLGLGGLLRGEIEVSLVRLVGPSMRMVQTVDGITVETGVPLQMSGEDNATEEDAPGTSFVVKQAELVDATFVLVDKTVRPHVEWKLSDIDVAAASEGPGHPLDLEGSAVIEGGDASMAASGPFDFSVVLAPVFSEPQGPFEIDLSRVDLKMGDTLRKAKGTRALLVGDLVQRAGGVLGIDGKLRLHTLDAPLGVDLADRTELRIGSSSFDVGGWDEIILSLADYQPEGRAAFENFVVKTSPLALSGGLSLDGVQVIAAEGERVTLRGGLAGTGRDGMRTKDLAVSLPGGDVKVEGAVTRLAAASRYDLKLQTPNPLRSNPLVTALIPLADTVFGPLALDVDLSGPLDQLLERANGHVRFALGGEAEGGRIKGVSLLGDTVKNLDTLSQVVQIFAGRSPDKTRSLQKYLGDEFQVLGGNFAVANGRATTNDLRIEYRGYKVSLQGAMGLVDGSLDMRGEIELDEEVDALLTGGNQRRVIPIASITGTVASPSVGLSADALAAQATRSLITGDAENLVKGVAGLFKKKKKKKSAPSDAPAAP